MAQNPSLVKRWQRHSRRMNRPQISPRSASQALTLSLPVKGVTSVSQQAPRHTLQGSVRLIDFPADVILDQSLVDKRLHGIDLIKVEIVFFLQAVTFADVLKGVSDIHQGVAVAFAVDGVVKSLAFGRHIEMDGYAHN
jgi:hypothetical protein